MHEPPKTIEALKEWYRESGLPPYEETRFFIGKDVKEARAFGIFKADGVCTVYKNKADGTRAIRYQGSDEAYAVNELFDRLKKEILNQKNAQLSDSKAESVPQKKRGCFGWGFRIFVWIIAAGGLFLGFSCDPYRTAVLLLIPWVIHALIGWLMFNKTGESLRGIIRMLFPYYMVAAMVLLLSPFENSMTPHYYYADDTLYCLYDYGYYEYDPVSDDYYEIFATDIPYAVFSDLEDYAVTDTWTDWDDVYDFTDTEYYTPSYSGSSDYDSSYDSSSSYDSDDSDYSWDSNSSWDSGSTDWDSDW